ncbi:MAG: NfeD family protein [Actinomycetota bacterium]
MSIRRLTRLLAVSLVILGLGASAAGAQAAPGAILALRLEGVVDGFVADYLEEGVADAEAEGLAAVLVEIDTPGGLGSAMDQISEAFLNATVPVICYVAPSGARAASAGAIILLSCPVAAMAPGTNVGASTPIGLDGGDLSNKIRNDAAAMVRSLAQRYGRDADTAERFVTEAASLTADEALEAGVIDLIANSRGELLATLHGATVMLGTGEDATLALGGPVQERTIGGFVGFLHGLFNPSLAFLFFWLGLVLLILELLIPGHVFSGTVGTVLLAISLWSFGLLPVRWVGLVLLVISVVAFVIELKAPGIGISGGIGIVTMLLGGWFLYDRTGGVTVSPVALVATAALTAGFFGFVVVKVMSVAKMPLAQGPDAIIGQVGVALARGVDERGGLVRVAAEEWNAVSPTELIPGGATVRVTRLDGLVLTVERHGPEHEQAGAPAAAAEGG